MIGISKKKLFLITLLSVGCFLIAFRLVATVETKRERIAELEDEVEQGMEAKKEAEEAVAELEAKYTAEEEARKSAEAEVIKLMGAKKQLEASLGESEERVTQLETEKGSLETDVKERDETIAGLEKSLKRANGELAQLTELIGRGGDGDKKLDEEIVVVEQGLPTELTGKISSVYPRGVFRVRVGDEPTVGVKPTLYAHRGDEVVGKLGIARIHATELVIRVADDTAPELKKGDQVKIEIGEDCKFFDGLEGTIWSADHKAQGILTIALGKKLCQQLVLNLTAYRKGTEIGTFPAEEVYSGMLIAEIRDRLAAANVEKNDTVKPHE